MICVVICIFLWPSEGLLRPGKNNHHGHEPSPVGQQAWIDEQDRPHERQEPLPSHELLPGESDTRRRQGNDTDERRGRRQGDRRRRAHHEELGPVDEHERDNEAGTRQDRRRGRRANGRRARYACGGEGRQWNRRRHVGDAPEVEDEEVGSQKWHAELYQGGGAEGGEDDVRRRRRKAHAKDHGAESREEERRQELTTGECDDELRHPKPDTRQRSHPDDDPGSRTRRRDLNGASARPLHDVAHLRRRRPGGRTEEGHDEGRGDTPERRPHGRAAHAQEHDDDGQGQEQVESLDDGLGLIDTLGLDPHPSGPEVNGRQERRVVQHSRDDGGDSDIEVRNIRPRGENEGAGTHDRGHELAPRACRRLDGPSEEGLEARPLHEGDCERPRRHDVGHGAAGEGAHERTGDGRGLGRSSPSVAGDAIRHGDEKGASACHLEDCPEEDEEVHEVRRHPEGDPPDALGG